MRVAAKRGSPAPSPSRSPGLRRIEFLFATTRKQMSLLDPSVYLSIRPCNHPSIYLCILPSIRLSIHLLIHSCSTGSGFLFVAYRAKLTVISLRYVIPVVQHTCITRQCGRLVLVCFVCLVPTGLGRLVCTYCANRFCHGATGWNGAHRINRVGATHTLMSYT